MQFLADKEKSWRVARAPAEQKKKIRETSNCSPFNVAATLRLAIQHN